MLRSPTDSNEDAVSGARGVNTCRNPSRPEQERPLHAAQRLGVGCPVRAQMFRVPLVDPDFRFGCGTVSADQSPRLDFRGSDARNPATAGDTLWVNYSTRRFSSRSMAF